MGDISASLRESHLFSALWNPAIANGLHGVLRCLLGRYSYRNHSFSYYKIFQTIKGHNQVMKATRQGAILSISVEEVKITKALFVAVLGLNVCWVPIAIVDIVDSFTTLVIPRQFFLMYMYLGYSSCSINPVIYGVMNRAFRAEFLRVFAICRSRSAVVAANSSTSQICRSATKTHRLVCEQV